MSDGFRDLVDRMLTEERAHIGSLIARASQDDRPVVERIIRRMAEVEFNLRTAGHGPIRDRLTQEMLTLTHSLEAIGVRYQIVAAHEARRMLMRLSELAVNAAFVAIDTLVPPLSRPGTP